MYDWNYDQLLQLGAAAMHVGISAPPPAMGYIVSATGIASPQGAVNIPVTFPALEPGDYTVNVTWGTAVYASANIPVHLATTRNCGGQYVVGHVFSKSPEVLIQGKTLRPGGTVWLLGIGYAPCSQVTLAIAPPHADYSVIDPHVRTDRYGVFRAPVHVPGTYRLDVVFVYPRVNGVT